MFRAAVSVIGAPATRVVGRLPWLIGAAALLALIYFDLGPPLAFNDDWVFAWSVRRSIAAHQLLIFPEQSAIGLVQIAWSVLFTLGNADQRLLRLSVVPFVAFGAICSYRLARALGAPTFWAGVAGAGLLTSPLFLTGATTFMSDTTYIGLLMAVALTGAAWIERGRGRMACLLLATLCPLQRQVGVLVPVALTVGLLAARGRRNVDRREWLTLAGTWAAVLAAGLLPTVAHLAPPTQANRLAAIARIEPLNQVWPVFYLPAMLGLCLVPLTAALALQPRRRSSRSAVASLCAVLALLGCTAFSLRLVEHGMIFPGDVFTAGGFTPTLLGDKVPIFPPPLFVAIEVLAMVTFMVLLVILRDAWRPAALGPRSTFLLALSGVHFVPLLFLQTGIFDRYYLPVVAPLVPLLAAWAARTTRPRTAMACASAAMVGGLALYVAGEQDYQAWQVARDEAARGAYQIAAPSKVDAGYEANGVYVEVPEYERTGKVSGGLARSAHDLVLVNGPERPRLRLMYAGPGDSRPGVDYHSLRPGRIVIDGV